MQLLISLEEEDYGELYVVESEKEDNDGYYCYFCVKFEAYIKNGYSATNLQNHTFDVDNGSQWIYYITAVTQVSQFVEKATELLENDSSVYDSGSNSYKIENWLSGYTIEQLIDVFEAYFHYYDTAKRNSIANLLSAVNKYYDSSLVDITNDYIMILYPELTIENSHGKKHKIKDLYVKLLLHSNGYIHRIDGFRGKISTIEFECGYSHSHLSRQLFDNFKSFCLGEDTPMSSMMGKFFLDEDEALLFLALLDSYLIWESLEGGPYIRMEEVKNYTSQNGQGRVRLSIRKKNLNNFLKKYDNVPVLWDNFLKTLIVDTNKIYPMIDKISTDVGILSESGAYSPLGATINYNAPIRHLNTYVSFKGTPVTLEISPPLEEEVQEVDYFQLKCNPIISSYIITELNNKLKNGINYIESAKRITSSLRN
jgi:hypothetical protein